MIYELREYVAEPGRMDAVHARFADHTLDLFVKHDIKVVGFWNDVENPERLFYLCAFADADAKKAAWESFFDDPEWQRVRAESEKDGPIVKQIISTTLTTAPYWHD